MAQGEQLSGGATNAPGLAFLPRQGAPRLLGRLLLEHLGLEALPPFIESVGDLMALAGFQPRADAEDVWERDGQAVRAGESVLEDGARLVWTWPLNDGDAEDTHHRVRYLGLASHDLRGALANIRSYAALLLNGRIPLEPKVQRGLETILRNADRALSFSQDYFDSTRADLGSLAFERERQALEPLLAAAVERHQAAARTAGVVLMLDGHIPLPLVNVDAGRIQHAVEALVQHLMARSQPGEVIHVRALPVPGGLRVEVRREGVPLSEEEAGLVFAHQERAFREKKLEDALRVNLARQEVEVHGGSVGVETDRAGTTLFFTLPLELSQELAPPASLQT
ncbi:sensor histidine kinase [Hyalangium rubrum]|uniref:histidine kinase n=1 Tax=Hyalangium rubrum TaxID=3103134 RepID=A0ABU5GUG6_9BACT|nr:HAMP domain-containing sensor histidine kinase [Hyalangium sp. s54d21]MDY7224828.1 HAMP domain-containing sensor histidine kinase [Hyalangium sp. s54d21]